MDTNNSSRLAARKKSRQHRKGHEPADRDPAYKYRSGRGHRKDHRHHHDKAIKNLDLGNLSRASGQRTGSDMVKNWLAQSTFATQDYPTVSEGHIGPRNTHRHHDLHEQRHSRPLQRHSRSSALLRPPVSPLEAGAHLRSPPKGFERPPNSHKRALSDSSILSVGKNQRLPPKDRQNDPYHANVFYGQPPAELSRRLEVIVDGSGSDESASPTPAYRAKKPRNKTRDDKYEHKKDRHRSSKPVEDRPQPKSSKRKKEERKRALTSSNNVMSNWASKAVLNDRITVCQPFNILFLITDNPVQQPLKPGIFQNGREANRKPVQDLVFSDMHFLQDRKGSTKPKPLSERRLRELEIQQKEMKEVSSFFLSAAAPVEFPDADGGHPGELNQETLRRLQENSASSARRYSASMSSQSEPSASREHSLGEQVLQRYRDCDSSGKNIDRVRLSQDGHHRAISSRDSKPGTYFSWSTSPPRSPIRTNGSTSQYSSGMNDRRTTTPETVRRALVDSGIFRGTGIAAYDQDYVSANSKATADEDRSGTESRGNEDTPSEDDMGRHEIVKRLEVLLPPAWRVDHGQTDQDLPSKQRLPEDDPGPVRDPAEKRQYLRSTTEDSRKDAAKSAKIKLRNERLAQGDTDSRRDPQCRSRPSENANRHTACLAGSANDDQLSITSRDLMPPPPLPHNLSRPWLSDTEKRTTATGPDTKYYPTSKELSAAARVIAQHANINENVGSKFLDGAGRDTLTGRSSQYGITPLQTASWVAPSPKLPTPSLTTDTTISRLSSTPPCDIHHPVGKGPFSTTSQVRLAQPQESIAEFIARIEREADDISPTPMPGHHETRKVVSSTPDTRFVGEGDAEIESTDFGDVFDGGMGYSSSLKPEKQPLRLPPERASYWLDEGRLITRDLEKTVYVANYECPRSEYDYQGRTGNGLELPRTLNQRRLSDDKDFEISSFWGPNNFMQF
ncbi:uncharacterized protein PG986_007756 [Apiospora aurea]|uniref:Uncharacterized protein n=1 Tax=Apiospora aurea TaxID=335848 RepID=A0ABR1QDG9_9PEZI